MKSGVSRTRASGWKNGARCAAIIVTVSGLSACNAIKAEKAEINKETKFSSQDYGVKSSPRITELKDVPKGGGRYQVGKPYTVRGKVYKPVEDPDYAATGEASWYGPNFHGRLTANGEVYNQYGLSAAHPTMPLPSYARVTNLDNNSSVMVRVNDRGPFAPGRIIDLSAKAAELLGYRHHGLAKVKVEYVGKARMDGHDDRFLLASYRAPGMPEIAPGASQPGTMIAMAPERSNPIANAIAGQLVMASIPLPTRRPADYMGGAPLRVADSLDRTLALVQSKLGPLSYADEAPGGRDIAIFAAVDKQQARTDGRAGLIVDRDAASRSAVIRLGYFADPQTLDHVVELFSELGVVAVTSARVEGKPAWEVTMLAGGDIAPAVVAAARARGLDDARIAGISDE